MSNITKIKIKNLFGIREYTHNYNWQSAMSY